MKKPLFTVLPSVLFIAATAMATTIPAPDDQLEPSIASGSNGYFVVWADKRNFANSEYDIYGARVSRTGEILDLDGIPICTDPGQQTSPRVTFNGSEFLVVWEDDRESGTNFLLYQIYGARVTTDGRVLDTNGFKITANQTSRTGPAVASDGNGFFTVWVEWNNLSNSIADIFGSPISADGVVANPGGIPLVQAPSWQTDPRIAYANGEYLVTYVDDSQIRGLRVATNGVPLSSSFAISLQTANDRHGLASNGRDFFELWGDYRSSPPGTGYPDIYGTLILSNGAVLNPGGVPIATNGYYAERPKIASDGQGFVAVWQESNDPTNSMTDIYGARLTANGELGSPARIAVNRSPGVQMNPDIAGVGTNILAVWQDGRSGPNNPFPFGAFDIYGTLINGLALNTNGLLISSVQTTNHPPIAFSHSLTANQGTSLFITLTASDADNDPLSYRTVMSPALGYLTGAPPNVLYVSTTNFAAQVSDSFTFVANDGFVDSAPATISITLFPQSSNSNGLPLLALIANDAVASEALNSDGTTNTATFDMQRTGNLTNEVAVDLFVHGSATYGTDYYTVPALLGLFSNFVTTVILPAGSTSMVFTLYPIPDNLTEGNEFAIFTINSNSNYSLGSPSQITVSLLNSNPPPVSGTRVIFPPNGAYYASTLDIKLRIANTNLSSVSLYTDDHLLASFSQAPSMLSFVTNFSVGTHTVYSVGNFAGTAPNVTSPPVHFTVLAPLTHDPLSPKLGIAPEANESFVLDSNGALFDFGDGRFGALADGGFTNQEPNNVTRPIQIPLPAGTNRFAKISSGSRHTLALTMDGSLYTCGDNSSGQTGTGHSTSTFEGLVTIPEFAGWKDIAAGSFHSLVLTKDGKLGSCGNNSDGQLGLGLGSNTNSSVFQLAPFPAGVTAWTAIGAGSNYSIALGNNGQLYVCGMGLYGILGNGGTTNSWTFVPVALPQGVTNWLKIYPGALHVFAVAGNGALYSWGYGFAGQLGNGGTTASHVPTPVILPDGVSHWLAVAAGYNHSLGLTDNGNLYGWGFGPAGQLGPGNLSSPVPKLIPPPTNVVAWKAVGAGINHSLGIGDNCVLYSWGANNFGQLGIGSLISRTNEMVVNNLDDLCAAPLVTITYPTDGSVFPTGANLLINADATSHDAQINQIQLFANGVLLASGTNTPFSFIWSNLVQGAYILTAAAADNINPASFSTSSPVSIMVSSSNTLPVVAVMASDAQAAEPPPTNNGAFTLIRTGTLQPPLTVLFRISGSATLNTDYQTSPPLATGTNTTIYFRTIPAGSNSATINIIPLADSIIEPMETVVLTLFTNSGYTIANPGNATVNILNTTNPPPSPPILSMVTTDPLAYELTGSGITETASFTVTRTGSSSFVRFPIAVSGTATYGVDYYTVPAFQVASNSSTAFFDLGSNQTSLVFTLYPIADNLLEGTETAIFTLRTNLGYTLGSSNQSVISIADGPSPPPLAEIIFPPNGSVFASPESINIKAGATNALELRVYADGQLLASSNPPAGPATFILTVSTNFPPGSHTVYAVGTNHVGLISNTYTSPPVHFQVLAPLEHPTTPSIGVMPEANASYVIDANGALFDWGADRSGALGDGIDSQQNNVLFPQQIPLGDGTNRWIKVAAGSFHALAMDRSGQVYSAGESGSGQLGRPNIFNHRAAFLSVPFPTNVHSWKDIAAGNLHSLGLTSEGQLFTWGNNSSGQLGLSGTNISTFNFAATLVPFPAGVSAWTAIGGGSNYSIALGNNGRLYTCGLGLFGTLGTGGTTNSSLFVPVAFPSGVTNWLAVAPGAQHVLAIAGNGALYSWGLGSSGQLGNGAFSVSFVPMLVNLPGGVTNWLALAAGVSHSLGLAENGNLYGWGNNVFGQLGPGSIARPVPTLVTPPSGVGSWKTVGAGINHSLAISDSCALYAWGGNSSGQLGIGSLVNQTNETLIQGLNQLCGSPTFVSTNHPPSFVKGPDITVPEDAGIHVFTNWAAQINPGAPSETNQTLTFIVTNDNSHLFSTQPGITPSGNLYFAVAHNSNGIAHVTVVLRDNGGTANGGQNTSAPQLFVITVTPVNDPPFAFSASVSVTEDIPVNIHLDALDWDGDPITYSIVTPPSHGELSGLPPNLTYLPSQNYNGLDSFSFKVNDGQLDSEAATISISVSSINDPPVPVVHVFPLFVLSSNYSAFQVISPNGSTALVFFDASLSTDPDGDALSFAWFARGTNDLFGTGIVATNILDIGTNRMTLVVNDGHLTVRQLFEVQVISPGGAVGELVDVIQGLPPNSVIKQGTWRQLIGPLQSAQSEFDRELWNAGLIHLQIFQSRVSAQIAPSTGVLANHLIHIAQQIADAVQGNSKHQPNIRSIENRARNHKSLTFIGTPGQIYLIQASGNLIQWDTIGIATETDDGLFQFDDIGSANAATRYYRLAIP